MHDVGYGKPPLHTRFGAGNNANPNGKTSVQRKAEIANAEKATLVRGRLLDAIVDATETGSSASLAFIESGVLKLIKDAEDRGLGTSIQSINHTTEDKSQSPVRELTDEQLQAIIDANAKPD